MSTGTQGKSAPNILQDIDLRYNQHDIENNTLLSKTSKYLRIRLWITAITTFDLLILQADATLQEW